MAKNDKNKSETTAVATTEAPGALQTIDYGDDAVDVGQVARGMENQTNEDIAIPFIKLLQPNSPEVAQGTVDGAMGGMFLNTISKRLYTNKTGGLMLVLAATRHEYIRWRPQDLGGGFVARYDIDDPIVLQSKAASKTFGEYYVDALEENRTGADGDELSETFTCFGVSCDEEAVHSMVIFPFKGSAIKCYKNMMTQIRSVTVPGPNGSKKIPPLFAHLIRLNTEMKQKDKNTWWVPLYTPAIDKSAERSLIKPDDERFIMAKAVEQMVKTNSAKIEESYKKTSADGKSKEEAPF